ncbi:MAG: hypothetical protein ABEJ27_04990 [Halodesulfurarchaeum sp.]
MNTRALLEGVGTGILAAFAVGLGVTAALEQVIWLSLLVGIPSGLLGGAIAFVVIYWVRAA